MKSPPKSVGAHESPAEHERGTTERVGARKIVLCTQDFPPDRGGIQTYCDELSKALVRAGHQVVVVAPGRGAARAEGGRPEIRRIRVPGSWLMLPLAWRLPRLIGELRPDAVLFAQWQLAVGLPRLPVRSGCMVHGRELLTSVLDPATPWILPRVMRRFDVVFPVSAPIAALLAERAAPRRVLRVWPGVDAERFTPLTAEARRALRIRYGIEADAVVLGAVGRLAERKNVGHLIAALPTLRDLPVRVVIAGRGPLEHALRAQAVALGVADRVCFLGAVADAELPGVMGLCDVLVLPGLAARSARDVEGFGIVFAEAAACGVPAVAGASGGIVDAVIDGETGVLVRDLAELPAVLRALIVDAPRREQLGRAARARVLRELTWAHTAQAIVTALDLTSGASA